MLSPGNEWSYNKRILIFSLGEKMNLNQETPRVDKKRSGLEGGSGYIISSEQEGWAKNWLRGVGGGGPWRGGTMGGELVFAQWHLQV